MAVYNERQYVEAAVESVLGQTFDDFEFIIIDDGSTDGSTEVLRRYAEEDGRIRLIEQANTGIPRAVNRGLAAARGPYIARMDGDDICLPERLALQVAFMDDHPNCVVLGGQAIAIDAVGEPFKAVSGPWARGNANRAQLAYDHDTLTRKLLNGEWVFFNPSVIMRAEAVRAVGGYDETYVVAQDLDLFLRLSEVGRVRNLQADLIKYRCHEGQISNQSPRQRYLSNRARREAHVRRGLPLPPDLRWPAMARSYAGMVLRRIGILTLV